MMMQSKVCSKCKLEKPTSAFHKRLNAYAYACKECKSASAKQTYASLSAEKREIEKEKRRQYHFANRNRMLNSMKEYGQKNKERLSDYRKKYYAENKSRWSELRLINPGKDAARVAKRHAAKLQATAPWANQSAIREIYEFAQELREAGMAVEVDHIIPLQGLDVSGLHVEQNLRVCLATVNRRKSNREWRSFL